MKSSTLLRLCLALEWIFIVASAAASSALESSLPEPLAAWLRSEAEGNPTGGEMIFLAIFIPLFVCFIVSTVGLFCLRRWAAWLYLFATVLGTFLMLFTGPTVEHAVADTLDEVGLILAGAVIVFAFFTDSLSRKAEQVGAQNP